MSQLVSLSAVASQTLSINLGGQACQIAVYTLGLGTDATMFMDLSVGGVVIFTAKICRNEAQMLLGSKYLGFKGDLMFIDLQGDTDPAYALLGVRYQLLYITAAELTANGLF